jgi:hypothetical protein
MFTIDIVLKYTPMPLSVQRKEEDDARSLYQQICDAMNSGEPKILELTCESKVEKRLTVATSEIIAVQMSQKGAAAGERQPGFFVATAES